jgi:photosystem II stability/assembly factor-like uncharacterized protein
MKPKIIIAFASLAAALAGCAADRHVVGASVADPGKIQITDIHMFNPYQGWAWSGGLQGQRLLLHTVDGGVSWDDVTPRGFRYAEEGACFYNARTAWIPTFNPTNVTAGILRTTDEGASWSLMTETNAPIFNEASILQFYSPTYGVGNTSDGGVGSSYVTYFETHDAGKTWSRILFRPRFPESGESSNTFHLSNIAGDRLAFYPPATVIVIYGDGGDEKPKGVLRFSLTTDLGKTWSDVELPLPKQYHDFLCVPLEPVFIDKKNVVLGANVVEITTNDSDANSILIFYTSHDGGATWIHKPRRIDLRWHGNGFDAVSPECFFFANDSNLCVTHDAGQSWQTITPNISFGGHSNRDIVQMDFVDAKHGWLIISDRNESHPDGNFILYCTFDGGKTWSELPMMFFHVEALVSI